MSLAEWVRGGRLLVTIVVALFFDLIFLGFTWLCFITNVYEGIGLGLTISSLCSLYSFIASVVLFAKGKEEGIFK